MTESKITTENCKDFLIQHFKEQNTTVLPKDLKRIKKYKKDDLWHRDFSHPEHGTICLVEKNGVLEIGSPSEPTIKYFKTFSSEDNKGAKALIKKFLKMRIQNDDDDIEEIFCKSLEFLTYQHAIPSQFTFYFINEEYGNTPDHVTNGLDSPMVFEGKYSNSFSIVFDDKITKDPESGANDVLHYGTLPKWTGFIDESHLACDMQDSPKKLTVRQFVQILFDLGFEYEVGDMGCLFEKEIKDFIMKKDLEKKIESLPQETDKIFKPKI